MASRKHERLIVKRTAQGSPIFRGIRWTDKHLMGSILWIFNRFVKKQAYPKKPKRIAFIKLWALGDSITTLPLIRQVKEKTKAHITIIATKRNREIYTGLDFVDEIITLDLSSAPCLLFKYKTWDVVFDLEPYTNSSALLARHIGKYCMGFADQPRSKHYDCKCSFPKDQHMVDTYLSMGKPWRTRKTGKLVPLAVTKKEKKGVDLFMKKNNLGKNDIVIGICPGAAESVRERIWPHDRFVKLADSLIQEHKAKILFVGSPNEKETIAKMQDRMQYPSLSTAGILNLKQTCHLIQQCTIFISNDTGPMHIAAAQGCKVLGLFGPNTPKRWAPYGKENISLYHKLWCSPCIINEKGIMPPCINKTFQKCMKSIPVSEVQQAVRQLLRNTYG